MFSKSATRNALFSPFRYIKSTPSRVLNSRSLKTVRSLTPSTAHYSTNLTTEQCIEKETKYAAHNYHPLRVVFSKAKGVKVWDPEGKEYYDFLSAYSAVNQGHCHPKLIQALVDQVNNLTLSSRAFYNNKLGDFAEYLTKFTGFQKMLPMNTGAEAVETAMKIARRWGYTKKNIPKDEAIIISCTQNFHGRTIAIISMADDPSSRENFGPFLPGVMTVKYNDPNALEEVLSKIGSKVCGFIVEPIQGEAGVVVPDDGYLKRVRELCDKHNVLMICDEIQTGIARTGKKFCYEYDNIKPDMVIMGKALSGGIYPVSAVVADDEVMDVITPGSHGSTYGGNPVACAVSMAALQIVEEEKLVENTFRLGNIFREETASLLRYDSEEKKPTGIVQQIRGRGLLNAFVINHNHPKMKGKSAYDICMRMKEKGLLAKQTHENVIRFAPPLVISEKELRECVKIIKDTIHEFES